MATTATTPETTPAPPASGTWVIVTGDFTPLGGMDRANHALASYLARQGAEAHLVTHRAWADAEHFQFGLLSDFWPHGDVAKLYGVFDSERGIATRGTFIIDKDGVVRWKVVNPIPQARDISDYQKALAELA